MQTTWLQDVRYAMRWLRRSPTFTAVAVLSLAIGIGANTAIFSAANALLLRPLPGLADPGRLADIGRTTNGRGFDTVSYPYYQAIRDRSTTIDVYAHRVEPSPMSLGGAGEAERVYGSVVSGNFFAVLGATPVLGRLLTSDDDAAPGTRAVAVISHDLWRRRFAADSAMAGRTILLNGHTFTVVGVAPAGFQGTTLLKPDLWVPIAMLAQAAPAMPLELLGSRRAVWLFMGGRLKDGVTRAQAQQELNAIAARLVEEHPGDYKGRGVVVTASALVPGQAEVVSGFMALLMGIVGLVLLIACVNVAGMMLARAVSRRQEIAVRLALGAARGRIVRQLLTESVVLFAAGGLAGVLLSRWLTALLLALLPRLPVPLAIDIPSDWRVLLFAVGLSVVAAVVSGLAPALQASRADLVPALKVEGPRAGMARLRLRNAFVVGQVAMSILLVIAAGLFFRALQHAAAVAPGFDERNVDVVRLDLALGGYTEATAPAFVTALLDRTRALPDVQSATATVDLPLDGGRFGLGRLRRPGVEEPLNADWNVVRPGFFRTMEMALVRGRDFTDADGAGGPGVAIVNEALARAAWPEQDPVGRPLLMEGAPGSPPTTVTVVGVAADARLISLTGPVEPYIYIPMAQRYMSGISILVRHRGPSSVVPQVRAALRELNPTLPISEALSLGDVTAIGLVPQRIAAAVAGSLGVVGLLLAAIGVYGVTAYGVSRRTREIGIRLALGADATAVLRLVLRQGLRLAAIGVMLGMVAAALASRLVESLLFGVRGIDPLTFTAAAALFMLVTLGATYLPARRAAQVDPMVALRQE